MRIEDTLAIATPEPPPGSPETGRVDNMGAWLGGSDVSYKDALEWRWIAGEFEKPGPATVWSRLKFPLIEGTSVLSDERGRVGVTTQSLLVTRRR
jgi:hypothetical protein